MIQGLSSALNRPPPEGRSAFNRLPPEARDDPRGAKLGALRWQQRVVAVRVADQTLAQWQPGASDMSRFRSQLSRLNAALAKRVLSELPQLPCSDTTLLRAVRNCAEMGQGRLTVALYEGHRATQTSPLKPELAAQLIRSLGTERLPHAPGASGLGTPSKVGELP